MGSKKENIFIVASMLLGIVIISFSWIYSRGLEIKNNQAQNLVQSAQNQAQSNETDNSHNQPSRSVSCGT
mgnify:FL=1